MIYLDSLASYPLLPEASEILANVSSTHYANSSSSHALGENANSIVKEARERIASAVGAYPSEIIFTSGATESNNLVLKGLLLPKLLKNESIHLVTSVFEHKCVLTIASYLESLGCEVTYLKSPTGIISAESVAKAIRKNTVLVSIMHVNNELGTITDIPSIAQVCLEKGIPLHTDAAQSFLKTNCDVDDLNIDFMSLSAHKIGGPKGIGAVYARNLKNLDITPLVHGAGHEYGMRGGTLAVPLIGSFAAALQAFPEYYRKLNDNDFASYLKSSLSEKAITYKVNGEGEHLNSCLNLTLSETNVDAFLRQSRQKFSLSQGSACSAGSIEPSHVLQALGLNREEAAQTLRVSFSHLNTSQDVDQLVNLLKDYS